MFKLVKAFKILATGVSLVILSFAYTTVFATVVTHHIAPLNLTAQANYHEGDNDKPALLIMHGFLTTNQFHTIRTMAKNFKDEGYTVLAPTLTLGVNLRKQSLKCDDLHNHTLENDVIEIESWIKWLESQGKKEIVVIGHSTGSHELLALLNKEAHPTIKLAIFTSLFYLNGPELGTLQSDLEYAQQALSTSDLKPHKYSFLFCKNNYFATPQSYLSYHSITRKYVLDALSALTIPHYTIMGGADRRYQLVGENWLDQLKQSGTNLITVEGANHFFSSEHEFDLQDLLQEIIQGRNKLGAH